MASLTTRSITKTSADLSSISIGSIESLNHIPSINLIQELSANLSKKYENLDSILNLNEVKYLGISETDPLSGTVKIHGIEYNVEDLDQGNIVFYEDKNSHRYDPDTGLVTTVMRKYILGLDKVWDVAGDLVNIPDGYIRDRHVAADADIKMSKIGGLLERLDEMQQDIDAVDLSIDTKFEDLQGTVNNQITINIAGQIGTINSLIDTRFDNIQGDIEFNVEQNIAGTIQQFNNNINTRIDNVVGTVNANHDQTINLSGEYIDFKTDYNLEISRVKGSVNANSEKITNIESQFATIDEKIVGKINEICGDVNWYNLVQTDVKGEIINMSQDIYDCIENVIAQNFVASQNVNLCIDAEIANLSVDILQSFYDVSCADFVNTQDVDISVNAASAHVMTNIQQAFADCSFGKFTNAFTGSESDNGTIMYFGGIYSSLNDSALIAALQENVTWDPEYTIPKIEQNDDGDYEVSTETVKALDEPETIYKMNRGCIILVGTDTLAAGQNLNFTAYMLNGFEGEGERTNPIWVSMHNENKYFRRSDIKVVTKDELPTSPTQMTEGELYFVVDDE